MSCFHLIGRALEHTDKKQCEWASAKGILQSIYGVWPVVLLTAFLVDFVPFLNSKVPFLDGFPGGPEDNVVVDGTSFAWTLIMLVTLSFGLVSKRMKQNLKAGMQDFYFLIPWCLPFAFFACFAFANNPSSISTSLQVLLPVGHLMLLWIWFVAFRQSFSSSRFLLWFLIALGVVAALQILTALNFIPGTRFDFSPRLDITGGVKGSYLEFFMEDGLFPFLKMQNGEVDLYQQPWLYVIDQWLQGQSVPFQGMAESGFMLCIATWLGCLVTASFRQKSTLTFWFVYSLCILSAFASFSRTGIWGSVLIIVIVALVTNWSSGRKLISLGVGLLITSIVMVLLFMPATTEQYLSTNTAVSEHFGSNFSGISVNSRSKLFSLFDYSYHFRIEEFKWLFKDQSIQTILIGAGSSPQFSHSFGLTFLSIFGVIGIVLAALPVIVLYISSIRRFSGLHSSTAFLILILNLFLMALPAPWLIVFPIMFVLLHEDKMRTVVPN